MPAQDIIVIGGSAGGLEALATVLAGLPRNFPGAIFGVLHTSPQSGGTLPQILERNSSLPVKYPADGEAMQHGQVYVAPPDHHLTLDDGRMAVHRGPRENGFRPAIDPLFRSAAKAHGERVVGIVLSGAMDDGTFGLIAIKQAGGTALVQYPYEAAVPSMPLSAIQNVEVDHIVRTAEMPALLLQATESGLKRSESNQAESGSVVADPTGRDISLSGKAPDDFDQPPTIFTCPECGGSLWEAAEGGLTRLRCHTGHGFTLETLLAAQNGKLENALWSAVRVLMERAALHRQLAHRTAHRGMNSASERYLDRAHQEERHAELIRELLSTAPIRPESTPLQADQAV